MVNFCPEIFLLACAATVLTFFIAGLLFICALSTSITWERTPHPVRRPAFSSHLYGVVETGLPLQRPEKVKRPRAQERPDYEHLAPDSDGKLDPYRKKRIQRIGALMLKIRMQSN